MYVQVLAHKLAIFAHAMQKKQWRHPAPPPPPADFSNPVFVESARNRQQKVVETVFDRGSQEGLGQVRR